MALWNQHFKKKLNKIFKVFLSSLYDKSSLVEVEGEPCICIFFNPISFFLNAAIVILKIRNYLSVKHETQCPEIRS